MKDHDLRFARLLLLVNGLVPLLLLGWDALHHRLGANPPKYAIHTTGMLALVFLVLTMAVTPIRKVTGWNWLLFSRRVLGLFAFFYACFIPPATLSRGGNNLIHLPLLFIHLGALSFILCLLWINLSTLRIDLCPNVNGLYPFENHLCPFENHLSPFHFNIFTL